MANVLRYWRTVVSRLARDDPLRPGYEKLAFVHPESVLNSFLSGSPIESRRQDIALIFPFRCNLSQRKAVESALTHSVSVVEGPPGTGKTETILNLIANIIAVQHMTVGIVSFGNAAVDNVRDKLDRLGFGHVIGNLGRKEKREEFFAAQARRILRSCSSWSARRIGQISSIWRIWTDASAGCRASSSSAPNSGRRSTPTGWSCGTLKITCTGTSCPTWRVFRCCSARPAAFWTIWPRAKWSWPESDRGRCGEYGTTSGTGLVRVRAGA